MISPLKMLSWNIAGRVRRCAEQVEALAKHHPDILALQEVRFNALPKFKKGLMGAGLTHIVESVSLAKRSNRHYGEIIASRWHLEKLPSAGFDIPYPERVLSAVVNSPAGTIEFHTAHIPPGCGNGWKKIETFEGIYKRLTCKSEFFRILCGDFNSPQTELPNGRAVMWGERILKDGRIKVPTGSERWVEGERSVIVDLSKFDLRDVFRLIHGYGVDEYSWFLYRKGKCAAKRRFDHIFASKKLNPTQCTYLHDLREGNLSDHSGIAAVFDPQVS